VESFSSLLEKSRFVFGTYAQLESDEALVRYLEFEIDRSQHSNVEHAIALHTRNRKSEILAKSTTANLYYRTEPRNYVASINKKWDSWKLETVGIEITIPFYKLGLPENIRTIEDLAKLSSLTVYLPASLSPQDIDELELAVFVSDGQLFYIDVRSLEFYKDDADAGTVTAWISGNDILSELERQLTARGGRRPTETIFR
jgi:hypothetical protein